MKEKPVFTVKFNEDRSQMVIVLEVGEESSAAAIDLDVSETTLKLESKHYELKEKLQEKVDPDSIRAKFSKTKKTLTLTLETV
jgi:HSP20 family molecular chaperone IbpA